MRKLIENAVKCIFFIYLKAHIFYIGQTITAKSSVDNCIWLIFLQIQNHQYMCYILLYTASLYWAPFLNLKMRHVLKISSSFVTKKCAQHRVSLCTCICVCVNIQSFDYWQIIPFWFCTINVNRVHEWFQIKFPYRCVINVRRMVKSINNNCIQFIKSFWQ